MRDVAPPSPFARSAIDRTAASGATRRSRSRCRARALAPEPALVLLENLLRIHARILSEPPDGRPAHSASALSAVHGAWGFREGRWSGHGGVGGHGGARAQAARRPRGSVVPGRARPRSRRAGRRDRVDGDAALAMSALCALSSTHPEKGQCRRSPASRCPPRGHRSRCQPASVQAAAGAGTTPACCSRPSAFETVRSSAIFPSAIRTTEIASTQIGFPAALMPISSPHPPCSP
jgi:hypothetical protein